MKEEILQAAKNKIQSVREKRQQREELLKKIEKLETNDAVREYLKLKEELDAYLPARDDEETLFQTAIRDCIYTIQHKKSMSETNKIYVYMKTYKILQKLIPRYDCEGDYTGDQIWDYAHTTMREDESATYRLYKDLESEVEYNCPIDFCNAFERENKVIVLGDIVTEEKFRQIQKDFFETALLSNQKEASKKVLSKKYLKSIEKN